MGTWLYTKTIHSPSQGRRELESLKEKERVLERKKKERERW